MWRMVTYERYKTPTETRFFDGPWTMMQNRSVLGYIYIYTIYTIDIQRFRFRIDPDSKKYDVHKRIFSSQRFCQASAVAAEDFLRAKEMKRQLDSLAESEL